MKDKIILNVYHQLDKKLLQDLIIKFINDCDEINVFLNEKKNFFYDFLFHEKINVLFTDGRFKENTVFGKIDSSNGFFLILDEKMNYPINYVKYMVDRCKEYSKERVITIEGQIKSDGITKKILKSDLNKKNLICNLCNIYVTCFHTDLLEISFSNFNKNESVNSNFEKYCQEKEKKILCITHPKNFVTNKILNNEDLLKKKLNKVLKN